MPVNDDRMWRNQHLCEGEVKRPTRSKFANLFLKRADRRTKEAERHLKDELKENSSFYYLEFIKEGMFQVFKSLTAKRPEINFSNWVFGFIKRNFTH